MIEVVGEALVDLVGDSSGHTFRAHPGGSPANVAVGLARLDVPVRLTTRFDDDTFGRLLRDHLDRSGVRLAPGSVVAGAPTGLAVATLDDTGAARYDFRIGWDLPPQAAVDGEWLHTGSLAGLLEPGATTVRALLEWAAATGIPSSYDPNPRPALVPDRRAAARAVETMAALATVVKASEEDLAFLYPGRRYDEVAAGWLNDRTRLVVVTRGRHGAYAVSPRGVVAVPAPPVEVADTVGAGDTFTATLLAGLRDPGGVPVPGELDLSALRDVVWRAVVAAGLTCAHPGAEPPSRAALDAALAGTAPPVRSRTA